MNIQPEPARGKNNASETYGDYQEYKQWLVINADLDNAVGEEWHGRGHGS